MRPSAMGMNTIARGAETTIAPMSKHSSARPSVLRGIWITAQKHPKRRNHWRFAVLFSVSNPAAGSKITAAARTRRLAPEDSTHRAVKAT